MARPFNWHEYNKRMAKPLKSYDAWDNMGRFLGSFDGRTRSAALAAARREIGNEVKKVSLRRNPRGNPRRVNAGLKRYDVGFYVAGMFNRLGTVEARTQRAAAKKFKRESGWKESKRGELKALRTGPAGRVKRILNAGARVRNVTRRGNKAQTYRGYTTVTVEPQRDGTVRVIARR
jgi:hypothetical protein